MYVESRKMVQMNLFAGQEYKCRCREWLCGHREETGWAGRLGLMCVRQHVWNRQLAGKLLRTTGDSDCALRSPRWWGGRAMREGIEVRIELIHNIAKQLCVHACWTARSCPTLCDPMDSIPPGSSVHKIFQARILELVPISSSRISSQPRDRTQVSWVSCVGR